MSGRAKESARERERARERAIPEGLLGEDRQTELRALPLPSEYSTNKKVKFGFWPWLSDKSP